MVKTNFTLVALLGMVLHADYLEVSRDVTIKQAAQSDAKIIGKAKKGELLALQSGVQESGYYLAGKPDGISGYVYRTFVRRHQGLLPATSATEERDGDAPAFTSQALPKPITESSFKTAKDRALALYRSKNLTRTFYCGCTFNPRDKSVDLNSCGTDISSFMNRAERIEWEHVVPASRLGEGRECYDHRERFDACIKPNGSLLSKRKCCEKVDLAYRSAHNDLVNLTPAVGSINAERSDITYGMIDGELRGFGDCDFEKTSDAVEPRDQIRGDIARIYQYMAVVHGLALTDEEKKMYDIWTVLDPPSEEEVARLDAIYKLQFPEDE